jgi:hypothetical protein
MKLDWLEKVLAPLVGGDEIPLLVLQVFPVALGIVVSVVANFILRRVFHRIGADRVDQVVAEIAARIPAPAVLWAALRLRPVSVMKATFNTAAASAGETCFTGARLSKRQNGSPSQ